MKNSFLSIYKAIIKEMSENRPLPYIDPMNCIDYINDALEQYEDGWLLEDCSPNMFGTYVCKNSNYCIRFMVSTDSVDSYLKVQLLKIGHKYGNGTYEGKEYLDLVGDAAMDPSALLWNYQVNLREQLEDMIEKVPSNRWYISKIMMSMPSSNFQLASNEDDRLMKELGKKEIESIKDLLFYLVNGGLPNEPFSDNLLLTDPVLN